MTRADELMALAGKFSGRGEFCADEGGVDGMDGDAICTTYSNAAHGQDRGELAAFIAAACNFVRSDAFRAMVRESQRYLHLRDKATRAELEAFADRRGTRLAADRLCDAAIDAAASGAGEGSGG